MTRFWLVGLLGVLVVGCGSDGSSPLEQASLGGGGSSQLDSVCPGTGVRELLTPDSVTAVDEALATEWGVADCREMLNQHGEGRLWCCRKVDSTN